MKRIIRVLAVIFAGIMLLTCGCSTNQSSNFSEKVYEGYENLAQGAVFVTDTKEKKNFKLKGKANENKCITVDLGDQKRFNTVFLRENGSSITLFEIYGSNSADKDYKFLYESDTIESGHTCFLGDVSYRYLKIFVNKSIDKYNLSDIALYNIKSENSKDLRVTTYLVAEDISEKTDFSVLDGITDIILFGTAKFDEKGNIYFVNGNGESVREDYYFNRVEIVKNAIGERDINLIADVAMPYGEDNSNLISMLSPENVGNTIANITAFVDKYEFDGYDMDYEYPYKGLEWSQFNEFVRKLDTAMPNKIISLAVAHWDVKFDADVVPLIDRAEVMLYDLFDDKGFHSTFASMSDNISAVLDNGFTPKQIDIGVPFYSRPTNRFAYWGSYNQFVSDGLVNKYTNSVRYNAFDHQGNPITADQYINSVQMIADKTAFAIDAGFGGMMIWHMACDMPYDNDLSLFKSINDTKVLKQK